LSTETEIKIRIQSAEDFCKQLNGFSPRIVSSRHFEDNHLLDFPDKKLQSAGCMVRIRYAKERSVITYKGPPKPEGIFKTREELETGLDDGVSAFQILERLGMQVWFRYQKYRREYSVDTVIIAVDETPIGSFVELEGTERGIFDLAHRIGIEENQFLRNSYYSLYLEECRLLGKVPGNMVFYSD
jgi:adenylate cyclase class 2